MRAAAGASDMTHAATMDPNDRIGKPFAGSLAIHACIVAAFLAGGWFRSKPDLLGDPHAGGIGVGIVTNIPIIPKQGPKNPLAHETDSTVPQTPPEKIQKKEKVEAPPPDAIPLPGKVKKQPPQKYELAQDNYRPKDLAMPNQIHSRTAPAAVSPMFAKAGSGQLAVGPNSPLGNEFGWYAQRIRDIIASKWNTADVTARPDAKTIITFVIERDGSVRAVDLGQASGSYTLDTSSKRAVLDANPLPPLPAGFHKSSAEIEIWFQLRR
jgi:protein TonB